MQNGKSVLPCSMLESGTSIWEDPNSSRFDEQSRV
jgi:hypothetical protein